MPATTTRQTTAQRTMQGIAVPAESVRPQEFFAKTRRRIRTEETFNYAHGDAFHTVTLKRSDILAGIWVRFVGSLVVTPGTGTAATTRQWPYNLINRAAFTANGASSLIDCNGLFLKARDIQKHSDLTDRGVTRKIGATNVDQGTLSQASENWGVGSGETAIAAGTYPVELEWYLPVAEDERELLGAVFLQTSSTSLDLQLRFPSPTQLFALTGNATAVLNGQFTVVSKKFSIPIGADGQIVVPDLSVFHSMIQNRVAGDIGLGENEHPLIGQGAGKSLLRWSWQAWNNGAPLALSAANFGRLAYRYGTSETPDEFLDGGHMRADLERRYNCDIGGVWGIGAHDFVDENAFRDVLDLGTTSELRLVTTLQQSLTLSSPAIEYVTEQLYMAG